MQNHMLEYTRNTYIKKKNERKKITTEILETKCGKLRRLFPCLAEL